MRHINKNNKHIIKYHFISICNTVLNSNYSITSLVDFLNKTKPNITQQISIILTFKFNIFQCNNTLFISILIIYIPMFFTN